MNRIRMFRVVASLVAAVITLGATPAAVGATQAASSPPCTQSEGFLADRSGTLYRMVDTWIFGVKNAMRQAGVAGTGWTPRTFRWVGAGGDGVLYAITPSGTLKWYRYDRTTWTWPGGGSGRVIGTGFVPGTAFTKITVGANGWLYLVRPDGALVLYRHTGWQTGQATWADSHGTVIGSGWNRSDLLVAQGDGTLYRQYKGTLYWYRHSDPAAGPVTWRSAAIGTGWRFADVDLAGGGVLYATDAGGRVRPYLHLDPEGGARAWGNSGTAKTLLIDPKSLGLIINPLSCQG